MTKITFIIPTRNNLPYLKLAYKSIRNYYKEHEIVILDDNSSDETDEWYISEVMTTDNNTIYYRNKENQVGHTVLYDKGVEIMTTDIFTIFHADMICGPNYVENLLKWLKPHGVVAATRIEPPLHPPGKEKIIKDFGTYDTDFRYDEFEKFCLKEQQKEENKDIITRGIFAPWLIYKEDFLAIGGHDKMFAPFPYEDSDIFQRMLLKGYDIKQSRDAFVYHFTCRGHRWTKEVQKDDTFYKLCCAKNMAHYLRKWGSWIQNDEYSYPVIHNKYDVGFVITNCTPNLLGMLEPWCSTIYIDTDIQSFIDKIQPGTPFDLSKRVKKITDVKNNEILVTFDCKRLTQENFSVLTNLSKMIKESNELGTFEYDIFSIDIKALTTFQEKLINNKNEYYQSQLITPKTDDPYFLKSLFDVYEKVKANT